MRPLRKGLDKTDRTRPDRQEETTHTRLTKQSLVHGTPQEHLRVHPEAREFMSSMPRTEPQLLEPPVVPEGITTALELV